MPLLVWGKVVNNFCFEGEHVDDDIMKEGYWEHWHGDWSVWIVGIGDGELDWCFEYRYSHAEHMHTVERMGRNDQNY